MTADTHAAAARVIHGALEHGQGHGGHNNYPAAQKALEELLAALTQAEQQRDEAVQRVDEEMRLHGDTEERLAAAEQQRDEALELLREKKQELAVAYGSGITADEREWFSALDKAKRELRAAEQQREQLAAAVEKLRSGAVGLTDHVSVHRDAYAALIALAAAAPPETAP